MDARRLGGLIEINDAKHVAVVGDGQALHAQFLAARHQLVDAGRAVQQAIFGMHMQMGKIQGYVLPSWESPSGGSPC